MIDVTAERMIPLPPDKVAAYAMDWRNDAQWTGIEQATLTQPAPGGAFGAGAEVTRTARFMGRRVDYVMSVQVYDPPALMEMVAVEGPFPMLVTYRFDRHAEQTLASIRVRGGKGLMGLLGGPLVLRSLRKDLARLEQRLVEAP